MTKSLSQQEALIYVMVTMSAVDRSMTDEELSRIGRIVSYLPVFDGYQHTALVGTAEACGKALSGKDGFKKTLDEIAKALPERLHEAAYALALEVAVADQEVTEEEVRYLELLRDKLHLSKLIVAALERGVRARHVRP